MLLSHPEARLRFNFFGMQNPESKTKLVDFTIVIQSANSLAYQMLQHEQWQGQDDLRSE